MVYLTLVRKTHNRCCVKATPSSKGIKNVEQNKYQLWQRIASVSTTLIYNSSCSSKRIIFESLLSILTVSNIFRCAVIKLGLNLKLNRQIKLKLSNSLIYMVSTCISFQSCVHWTLTSSLIWFISSSILFLFFVSNYVTMPTKCIKGQSYKRIVVLKKSELVSNSLMVSQLWS